MKVSVVVCTYAPERFDDFAECVESLLAQTYDDVEIVVGVDGRPAVFERVKDQFGEESNVTLHCNDDNVGLLESRNTGAELATGDVVAFIDDDAIADEQWVETLVATYEDRDANAVGGRMTALWVDGKPAFLPEEFYWLVGVTHRGFADGPGEVRNTFGSNISFCADVFKNLGGFDTNVGGRQGDANLQGGETELCARLQSEYGTGIYYVPDAEVAHKVFDYRTRFRWLLDRAFWQGYSKRGMETIRDDPGGDEEDEFLKRLVTEFVPSRLSSLVTSPSTEKAQQLVGLFAFTGAVGAGYVYGVYKW